MKAEIININSFDEKHHIKIVLGFFSKAFFFFSWLRCPPAVARQIHLMMTSRGWITENKRISWPSSSSLPLLFPSSSFFSSSSLFFFYGSGLNPGLNGTQGLWIYHISKLQPQTPGNQYPPTLYFFSMFDFFFF